MKFLASVSRSERLDRYAALAAQRLPLFQAGPPSPNSTPTACIGCGVVVKYGRKGLPRGWKSRKLEHGNGNELHCPACFSAWAWGDQQTNDTTNEADE